MWYFLKGLYYLKAKNINLEYKRIYLQILYLFYHLCTKLLIRQS